MDMKDVDWREQDAVTGVLTEEERAILEEAESIAPEAYKPELTAMILEIPNAPAEERRGWVDAALESAKDMRENADDPLTNEWGEYIADREGSDLERGGRG